MRRGSLITVPPETAQCGTCANPPDIDVGLLVAGLFDWCEGQSRDLGPGFECVIYGLSG